MYLNQSVVRRKILYSLLCFGIFFGLNNAIQAQDLHYSQFYNSPLNVNPALTGIFNGDKRITGSLRDQWRFVPVPWFTFSGAYDMKIYPDNSEKSFWGLGVNFNYDRQGDSRINLSTLNISGSYNYLLNKSNVLTGGLLLGYSTRGFSPADLTWDKQWTGDTFDPGLGSGEAFDGTRVSFLETAAGVNYRWQKTNRTKVDLGVGLFHLIEPSVSYYDGDTEKLPRRLNFMALGNFQILDAIDIQVHGLHQRQEEYDETIIGALGKFYVNQARGKETQVHVGFGYRTSGSLIPTFAVEYKSIYASFSYDADVTDFNDLGESNRGGPEFHVRYIITNVKPMNKFKVCPIY